VYGSGGLAKLVGGACGALENESAVPAPPSAAGRQWRRSVHTLPSLHSTQQWECERPSKLSQGQPSPGQGTGCDGRRTCGGGGIAESGAEAKPVCGGGGTPENADSFGRVVAESAWTVPAEAACRRQDLAASLLEVGVEASATVSPHGADTDE
jgi:hypothetical protein